MRSEFDAQSAAERLSAFRRLRGRVDRLVPSVEPGSSRDASIPRETSESAGDPDGVSVARLREVIRVTRRILDSVRRPAPLSAYLRLQAGWRSYLRRGPIADGREEARRLAVRFPDVLIVVHDRLASIAARLGCPGADETGRYPGMVGALHDVLTESVARIWFEPEGDLHDATWLGIPFEKLSRGMLLVGGRAHASVAGLDRLEAAEAYGVFRIDRRMAARLLNGNGSSSQPDSRPRDLVFKVRGRGRLSRLRLISWRRQDRTFHVLTNALDRDRLDAEAAIGLATTDRRLDRLFRRTEPFVPLSECDPADLSALESRVHAAAIIDTALRATARWSGDGAVPRDHGATLVRLLRQTIAIVSIARGDDGGGVEHDATDDALSRSGGVGSRILLPAAPRGPGPGARARDLPVPAEREEMLRIAGTPVDPAFEPFCAAYARVGHRNGFLWRWVQRGLELTALPSVDPEHRGRDRLVKLLGVMLDVLMDDVADNFKDPVLLRALLDVPFSEEPATPSGVSEERAEYFRFTVSVWREIETLFRRFPRYGEFQEVLEFDYRQLLNTMRYAFLVNRVPEILNTVEHDLYQPHNMHMMISGTLDLMCSSAFDSSEFSAVRQALWRGQVMGRIGNMVSTWEREIHERDFTSGVFAEVIQRGLVGAREMAEMPSSDLTALIEESGVIEHFLSEWTRLRDEVYDIAATVRSVDLHPVAAGLEQLIRLHLGSRGLK